jgi:hypothetical protein
LPVGATFSIVTEWLSESVPPSPSPASTLTVDAELGLPPSAKTHLNELPVLEAGTYEPFVPQSIVIVSASLTPPGSEAE